ncbi:hypothetical protein GLA29479_3740 [Lysobacter antibioticus]|nr:hypothetical protein GLA29479_3740 [Lysobacter antibioticus]
MGRNLARSIELVGGKRDSRPADERFELGAASRKGGQGVAKPEGVVCVHGGLRGRRWCGDMNASFADEAKRKQR